MPKEIKGFECEHCGKFYKTHSGVQKHEKSCASAPPIVPKFKGTVEKIRTESKSIAEVIQRLQDYWLACGYKVTFHEIPTVWGDCLSNSHNAPIGYEQNWGREPGKPLGYPGWGSDIRGTVHIIDDPDARAPYFSDLVDGLRGEIEPVPWINTGSGGSKNQNDFYYSSTYFYIYDFPLMRKEWEENDGEISVVMKDYEVTLEAYYSQFKRDREIYIRDHTETMRVKKLKRELEEAVKEITAVEETVLRAVEGKFNKDKSAYFPTPPEAFGNNGRIFQIYKDLDNKGDGKCEKFAKAISRLTRLAETASRYVDNNPEKFV